MTYEGTVLSGELQQAVLREVMQLAGLESQDWSLPAPVQVRHGVNARGHAVHYYLNYSAARQEFVYPYVGGRERLKETPLATEAKVALEPWGVAIIEEGIAVQ